MKSQKTRDAGKKERKLPILRNDTTIICVQICDRPAANCHFPPGTNMTTDRSRASARNWCPGKEIPPQAHPNCNTNNASSPGFFIYTTRQIKTTR
ncbi:unnamed protein product [Caenorhabditis auriculariae]|uniref:Uncharacterized protein n=1 Tax=Caenorhabditis auriculariae TaxID=2777116 RepID=A0A8S1HDG0_9PELO|nr:unnamed protein product [Caenorhabditis auriculariae]